MAGQLSIDSAEHSNGVSNGYFSRVEQQPSTGILHAHIERVLDKSEVLSPILMEGNIEAGPQLRRKKEGKGIGILAGLHGLLLLVEREAVLVEGFLMDVREDLNSPFLVVFVSLLGEVYILLPPDDELDGRGIEILMEMEMTDAVDLVV